MNRRILPDRRFQDVVDLEHGGSLFRVAISRFEDGSPGEVHIDTAKPGSTLGIHAHDVAALVTLLLQNGAGISQIENSPARNPAGLAARIALLIRGAA